jgi:hypothetical protein
MSGLITSSRRLLKTLEHSLTFTKANAC